MEATPVFDRETMLERLGGDEEFLLDVLEVFLEESPRMLEITRVAVEQRDAEALERAAHALKGALLNISADSAAAVALLLEQMGKDREMDLSPEALAKLESEIERLGCELSAESPH